MQILLLKNKLFGGLNLSKNHMGNKKLIKYIVLLILVLFLIFFKLGNIVMSSNGKIIFDENIMNAIHKKANPTLKNIMKFITFFGSGRFYISLGTILTICFVRRKKYIEVSSLAMCSLGSYGLNELIKHYYRRIRPIKYFLIKQGGYSFPSGHAMVSMTFYSIFIYIYLRNKNWGKKKVLIWILNYLFIGLIGFSRIYLGVHWPTDVIGGYIIGLAFYLAVILIFELQYNKKEK